MEMEEAKNEMLTIPQRGHRRSAARVRYYKPAGAQHARRKQTMRQEKKPATGFKERMVFQAIVCGGLLAMVLFFNIIDTAPTNAVADWINTNISYDMLAEEDGAGGWVNSILGIFNNDEAGGAENYGQETAAENPAEQAAPVVGTETSDPDVSRIDENILREINYADDGY